MCSRYVGPEKRPDVVKLYKFQDPLLEIDMANLLQGLNVVLRVISSWRRKVKMEKKRIRSKARNQVPSAVSQIICTDAYWISFLVRYAPKLTKECNQKTSLYQIKSLQLQIGLQKINQVPRYGKKSSELVNLYIHRNL